MVKPSGICFSWFSSEPKLPDKSAVPIKMWATMSLEQKMWIIGGYFHYSAVDNISIQMIISISGLLSLLMIISIFGCYYH